MKTLPRTRPKLPIFWNWTYKNIPDQQLSVSFKIRKSAKSLHPTVLYRIQLGTICSFIRKLLDSVRHMFCSCLYMYKTMDKVISRWVRVHLVIVGKHTDQFTRNTRPSWRIQLEKERYKQGILHIRLLTCKCGYKRLQTGTDEYIRVRINTDKYVRIQIGTNEYRWVWINTDKYVWIQTGTNEYRWVRINTDKYLWIQIGMNEYRWVRMNTDKHVWTQMSTDEYRLVYTNTDGQGWIQTDRDG